MSDDSIGNLARKLDVLIRLKAMELCAEGTQREKIAILDMAGLQPKEIAEMLGTTSNTVSVALSNIRKDRKQTGGKRTLPKGGAKTEA